MSERDNRNSRDLQLKRWKYKNKQRRIYVRRCQILLGILVTVILVVTAGVTINLEKPKGVGVKPLSKACEDYRSQVETVAKEYDMLEYVDLIMAVMMQESSGRQKDVMQAAEGKFNERYPREPNGITDPDYSIECGIQELNYALELAKCKGPDDLDNIRLALQAYNFGADGFISYVNQEEIEVWTEEVAAAFAEKKSKGKTRNEADTKAMGQWKYGDQFYPEHVLRYYHK